MKDHAWLKLLDLAAQKLGADDARIEIGGREPSDATIVWVELDETRRLVLRFTEPPSNKDEIHAKLVVMLESFHELLAAPPEPSVRTARALHRELDHALLALAERTGAETAWIIDTHSPVLWGSSEPHEDLADLEGVMGSARADQMLADAKLSWTELLAGTPNEARERLLAARLSAVVMRVLEEELEHLRMLVDSGGLRAAARRLRSARALLEIRARAARERDLTRTELRGSIQCFAHSIAGQYQLVLVFDETYSPLHAEGNVQRALPHIERLLLSLPPVDPMSGRARGAKVLRLPRRG